MAIVEGRGKIRWKGSGRVLFFGIEVCKVVFFGRILINQMYVAWNVGRLVAGGVFAAGFAGHFGGVGDAESAGWRKTA
ncbi:MAG: hypothetical protein QG599_1462 [Pseudomonadota bacterium]|nr:hypothetical protein [Pseudomonadota bacterium]